MSSFVKGGEVRFFGQEDLSRGHEIPHPRNADTSPFSKGRQIYLIISEYGSSRYNFRD